MRELLALIQVAQHCDLRDLRKFHKNLQLAESNILGEFFYDVS
jgi:hypothetical protein